MAEVARATGRLDVAEDSVQDACVVAVQQWTAGHVPRDPQAWLTGVARHKALDRLRRESRRPAKEATASEATAKEATGPVGGAARPVRPMRTYGSSTCAVTRRSAPRRGSP